jgi:hypothetical protein
MKVLSLVLAAVVIAFSFPACAHKSTASDCCSSSGSCTTPDAKGKTTSHTHKKKSS